MSGTQDERHLIDVEPQSRAEIYAKYVAGLARFATGLVGPAHAADVVSEAVVKSMWSPSWDTVANPRAYLYQAVLNESRMHHRGARRRRSYETKAAVPDVVTVSVVGIDVWDAMGHLSLPQRACIFLRYWEGMTTAETAAELSMSTRTVRRHIARGRSTLKGILQ